MSNRHEEERKPKTVKKSRGRVRQVETLVKGAELEGGHAKSVAVLRVTDTADFSEDSWVRVEGDTTNYAVTAVDSEKETITITPVLKAAAVDGDKVTLWCLRTDSAETEKVAKIAKSTATGDGDTVTARVSQHLSKSLPDGVRESEKGESVEMLEDEDDLLVTDAPGVDEPAAETVLTVSAFSAEVQDTNMSPARPITHKGTITDIWVKQISGATSAVTVFVGAVAVGSVTVASGRLTGLNFGVSPGDGVRFQADKTGGAGLSVVVVYKVT